VNPAGEKLADKLKYNCVFGGGGIRGMCYVGAINALKEFGVEINSAAGSSVGAVFAALFAAGCDEKEINALFLDFNFNMFRDLNINIFDSDISLSKGEIFLEWLRKKIGKKVFGAAYKDGMKVTFSDIDKNLYILTLDLNTNMPYVFSKSETPDEEIAFAVRCSAGLPGLMKPINYKGMLLVDGDLIKSWPAWKIYNELNTPECRLLEFRLEGSRDGTDVKNPLDYLNSIINVVWYLSTENVYTQYKDNDRYDYIVIDTKDIIMFDFSLDKNAKEQLAEIGYQRTKEYFLKNLVSKKENLLKIYNKVYNQIYLLETKVNGNNIKESLFILNEILSDINKEFSYADVSICEQLNSLKSEFMNTIQKRTLFYTVINNKTVLKEQILYIKNLLKKRIIELSEYIEKYKNKS